MLLPGYFLYKVVAFGEEETKKMIIRRARVAASKTLSLVKMEIKVLFFSTIPSFDVATDRSVHSIRRVQRVYA